MYSAIILMYPENLRRRRISFALPNLQDDTTADKHLLFTILMFTVGSLQVEPRWNHISQWLIPVVRSEIPCYTWNQMTINEATLEAYKTALLSRNVPNEIDFSLLYSYGLPGGQMSVFARCFLLRKRYFL